jgi:hypothetical protein
MRGWVILHSVGDWREYNPEQICNFIYSRAGNPDLTEIRSLSKESGTKFESLKSEFNSIISALPQRDGFVDQIEKRIKGISVHSTWEFLQAAKPTGNFVTSDITALTEGLKSPPHLGILAEMMALQHPFKYCGDLAEEAIKLTSHLERKSRSVGASKGVGTNIFIGHGRSKDWKELKDYISE